jgi:hypothetical protein
MADCFECGRPSEYEHHVVPISRGGTKTVPLCGECHGLAHHRKKAMSTSTLTKEALAKKRQNGESCGSVPYGWTVSADGIHLERCDLEQKIISRAHELRADGLSLRKVGAALEGEGLFPRHGMGWHAKTVQGLKKRWHAQTVKNILNPKTQPGG